MHLHGARSIHRGALDASILTASQINAKEIHLAIGQELI
jgi:hypothetical protein